MNFIEIFSTLSLNENAILTGGGGGAVVGLILGEELVLPAGIFVEYGEGSLGKLTTSLLRSSFTSAVPFT